VSVVAEDTKWQSLLDDLAKKHVVPGASLAVLADGEITTAVTGVTHLETQAPVGVNTLFQIGSTTKTYTATLVMQLVDEGLLELDQPAADVIKDLRFGSDEEGRKVTVRQLLAHTSGLLGDDFGNFPASDDWGRGEDAVERYVTETCPTLPRISSPDHSMSYNNAGYIVLGRLIETLRGKPYAAALKEHLLGPLGATRTATLPEEAIMHSVAVGHTPADAENLKTSVVAPLWQLPTAYAPAGALLCACPTDVLLLAHVLLNEGKAQNGTQILSPESVAAMRAQQIGVPLPNMLNVDSWGLGLFLFEWSGQRGFGHNGDTIGQHCEFRVFPDSETALVLSVNGGIAETVFAEEVTDEVFSELADIRVPKLPTEPVAIELDLTRLAGTFSTPNVVMETKVKDGSLVISIEPQGAAAALSTIPPLKEVELVPVAEGGFMFDLLGVLNVSLAFFDFDEQGKARYLHLGARATPRADL